jgi:DNA-binding NtrC family response regulator
MNESGLLEGKRILIVDDEADVLDTLEELLDGCEVRKASSYEEARSLLEREKFDIAILDIMGIKGYELLDLSNRNGITAVMLTAHALTPESVVRSYREGAASFLPKEKMTDIKLYLCDVLEAKQKNRDPWWRWLGRFYSFWKEDLGKDWRDLDEEFYDKLKKL